MNETGQPQKTTTYLGGMIFENDVLQHIATEEGRMRPNGSGGIIYDYFLKDHLGNTRMISFRYVGVPKNQYKFNAIEQTKELDLNQYDAYFRTMDPQLGRWWQIDPKPTFSESPYVAMGNNPLEYIDFLGDTTIDGQAYEKRDGEYLPEVVVSSERKKPEHVSTTSIAGGVALTGVAAGSGVAGAGLSSEAAAALIAGAEVVLPLVIVTAIIYPFSGEPGTSTIAPRPSTKGKHEKGAARKSQDRSGGKGMKNPPRKRPDGLKGKWPSK